MPQFDFALYASQIFWLAIVFVAFYLVVANTAIPRIAHTLEDRQMRISNDLDAADRLQAEAEQVKERYEAALVNMRKEASDIRAQARADMEAKLAQAASDIDEKLATRLDEAMTRIAEARAAERARLEEETVALAQEAVKAVGLKAPDLETLKPHVAKALERRAG